MRNEWKQERTIWVKQVQMAIKMIFTDGKLKHNVPHDIPLVFWTVLLLMEKNSRARESEKKAKTSLGRLLNPIGVFLTFDRWTPDNS